MWKFDVITLYGTVIASKLIVEALGPNETTSVTTLATMAGKGNVVRRFVLLLLALPLIQAGSFDGIPGNFCRFR